MPPEFRHDIRIDPVVTHRRMTYLLQEFLEGAVATRALMDEAAELADADLPRATNRADVLRRVILRDRLDELRQWDAYVRPRTRIGRAAYRLGIWFVRVARAIG